MSENETKTQQVTSKVEKVVATVGARIQAAVGELESLQAKGLAQATTFTEAVTRATHEQLAFAEQMGSEWRKLVLGATRKATEYFTPKA
jgi:hypothetical protein